MGDPFATFISEMIDAKEWGSRIDESGRQQLTEDLHNRLMDQIDRAVVEALPEDKIDDFNTLLDREASDEEVQQFIANSGVDVQAITMETMFRFRELYLGQESNNPE